MGTINLRAQFYVYGQVLISLLFLSIVKAEDHKNMYANTHAR